MNYYIWCLYPNGSEYRKEPTLYANIEETEADRKELILCGFDVRVFPENELPPKVYVNPRKRKSINLTRSYDFYGV